MELQLMNERRHNKIYNDESYTYKIFNIDYDKKDVFQEAFITSKVEELDAHAPLIDSVYKKDGQWCIKFDLIKGESLFSLINNNPENIKEYINKLVTIQTSIHTNFCTAIPRQKAKLQYGIKNSGLDESTQFDLLEMLDSSPKHKKLCHGNLTPHNIIISGDDYCVLDWNHASQGNASADIARTYIWFKINMPEYAELYLDSFCNMTGTTKRYVNQWLPIVATARIYKDNPEEFIIKAASLINDEKATAIIQHITYDVMDEKYDTDIFTDPTIKGRLGVNAMKAKRHLYDHVVYDSTNELEFATELDSNKDVAVYVKLPDGFYISTPVGHYNPDWAIPFYEGTVKHIYFVAETKGSMNSMQLRLIEESKIHCAREHFKAISNNEVVYDVVDSYKSLLDIVTK